MTRSCLKSIGDKGPNKVRARHKTYSPVRQLGGHSWDRRMTHTHTHRRIPHTHTHALVGGWGNYATNYNLANRLWTNVTSEWDLGWAGSLAANVTENLSINLYALAVASQTTTTTTKNQNFKASEINNIAREKNEVRCSPLCETHTPTQNKQWKRLVVFTNSPSKSRLRFCFLRLVINTVPRYLFFITLH